MTERFIRDTSAPFNLAILPVDDPGAGADFVVKLPEEYTYEILSITLQMVADANAANRNVTIRVHLGTDLILLTAAEGLQTATETLYYSFAVYGISLDLSALSGLMLAQLPDATPLPGAVTISSLTDSIQVGDQISNIRFYLKRWPILEG